MLKQVDNGVVPEIDEENSESLSNEDFFNAMEAFEDGLFEVFPSDENVKHFRRSTKPRKEINLYYM